MYKIIQENEFPVQIYRKSDKVRIPKDSGNRDYQQFLQDVKDQGLGIVEGPDVLVKEDYATARREAYGPIEDQLDKIYHKGIDVWKSDILAIKDAIPRSQQRTTSVGSVPDWVQTEVNVLMKNDYLLAVERLNEPKVALGEKVLIADNYWDPEQNKVIEGSKYTYINVPAADDPAVVSDELQRDAAQATIDGTPQSIIDSINT